MAGDQISVPWMHSMLDSQESSDMSLQHWTDLQLFWIVRQQRQLCVQLNLLAF